MKITTMLAFAAAAVALPTGPAAEAGQLSAKRQLDSLLSDIPINVGTSLKRPNGDVIGILKTRQDAQDLKNINPDELLTSANPVATLEKRQSSIDTSYLQHATYLENKADQLMGHDSPTDANPSPQKRERKELSDLTTSELQSAAQGAIEEKPVNAGVPLNRRTQHELDELTVDEVMHTSERVMADDPVTVGMTKEQREGLVNGAENLGHTSTSALD